MLFLYRFFYGIVEVEFFGIYPEKVLNLAAKHGISIWSARYIKQRIRCKIMARDFLKLPHILRKSGIRVHIIAKKGFPFFINKYNKRLGIFVGLIVFFLILQLLSSFVWVVDVKGNEKVNKTEILSMCREIGIDTGVRKSKISPKPQAQELLLKMEKLAWGSLNLEGCKLTVNVTEVVEKKEDNSVATNLVSTADGKVTYINVTSGNCLVKVGDVVTKGDVLVSGIIENENGTRFVHSIGVIKAITETEVNLEQNLSYKVILPNGRTKQKRVLEFFTLKIPLYLGGEVEEYVAQKTVSQLKLFSQNLPIKIHTKNFKFIKSEERKITPDEAVKMLDKELETKHKGTIKSKTYTENEQKVKLKAIITDTKNIAVSENLIFGIGKE